MSTLIVANRIVLALALAVANTAVSAAVVLAGPQPISSLAQTRRVGKITITADRFVESGDGFVRATGNVHLGNGLRLTGPDAMVTFDGASVLGAGTLEMIKGDVALFSGGFRAKASTGVAMPLPGARSRLRHLGRVRPMASAISEINIAAGSARGEAVVRLGPNQQVTSTLDFNLLGGLFTGQLPPLAFEVSGVNIVAPNGLQLTEGGFYAPNAVLTLPLQYGGGSIMVNDLRIADQAVSLGGADGLFALPEVDLSGNGAIRLTNNVATLNWDPTLGDYRFDIATSLVAEGAMPGTANATMTLASTDGQPQLSGQIPQLTFDVAGGTLSMADVAINNQGLSAPTATLTLPTTVGAPTVTLNGPRVDENGLSVDQASFFMPGFTLAGDYLGVTDLVAALVNTGGQYAIAAQGTLTMNLPGNEQSTDVMLTLAPDGQLSGEVTGLQLSVGGTTLALGPAFISSAGLTTTMAMLQLPDDLGGATAIVTDVVINQNGLSFGSAGAAVNLPTIPIGDQISLTDNRAELSVIPIGGKDYYALNVASTLQIDVPGNEQQQQIRFVVAPDADGHAQVLGTFSGLTLDLGSATLALSDVVLNNAGLFAGNASLALAPELGGAATSLDGIALTANGLSVNDGTFTLPTIVLADGALVLNGAQANLSYDGAQYRVNGQGKLTLNLPNSTGQTNTIAFTLGPDGSLVSESPGLALNLGSATLDLGPTIADSSGISVSVATLSLPPELSGVSVKAGDVSATSDGLALGDVAVSGSVPNVNLGRGALTDNAVSVARVRTEAGDEYALVLDGTLDTGSGAKPVRVILNTGEPIAADGESGLGLKLGNVNFTLMAR